MSDINVSLQLPGAFKELFDPWRYKIYYGGRGGAKSWAYAIALLMIGMQRPLRVLCARELQISISDSVHKLLSDIISEYGLDEFYQVRKTTILGINGTQFLFKGLRHNATEIKSTEGVDVCWVEEAEKVSDSSWELLIPTIRKNNSEIWISFNPKNPTDATYQRFVATTRDDAFVKKVSWRDNPFFTGVLDKERRHSEKTDPEAYNHIWEGNFDTRYFGGVYAKHLTEVQEQGRFLEFLYDPELPVHTAWDLGYSDSTSIIWWQIVYQEIRIIEYYEDYGQDVEFYCDIIKSKDYTYGSHYVPHDAANKLLAAGGRSIYEQMRGFGLKNIQIIPATSQQNGIEAARQTLKSCWFQEPKTRDLIRALMHYQFEYDEDLKSFKDKPLHNWASHACDAFEIIGQVWRNPKVKPATGLPILGNSNLTFKDLVKLSRQSRRDE